MESGSVNRQRRASGRGGWIALFSGESRGKAVERAISDINDEGYRVVFIVEDSPGFFSKLLNVLLALVTLGFYWRTSDLLIIGERM